MGCIMHVKIDKSVNEYLNSVSDKENKKTEYLLKYSKEADGTIVISAEKKGAMSSIFKKQENNIVTIFDCVVSPDTQIESNLSDSDKIKFAEFLAEKIVKHYDVRDRQESGVNKVPISIRIEKTKESILEKLPKNT
jgi:hypothetical protein